MGLSVRIAADFVFTIFWGWPEKLSHWNPSSISWGISSEDYDPGGRTCCTRCSCWGNMCCYRKTPWRYLHDQLEQQDLSCFQLTFSQPPVLIKPKQQIIRPSVSQRFSLSLHSQSSYGQPPTIWQRLLDAVDARASAAIRRITTSHLGFEEGFSVSRRLQFRASRRHSLTQPSDRVLAIAGA